MTLFQTKIIIFIYQCSILIIHNKNVFENWIVIKDKSLTIKNLLPIRLLAQINSNKPKYTKLHEQDDSGQQAQGKENKNDFMFIHKLIHEELQKYDSDKYLYNGRNANEDYIDYKKEFDLKHEQLTFKFNIKHMIYKKIMKYFLKRKTKKHFQKMVKKLFSIPKKSITKDISYEQIKNENKKKTKIEKEASTCKTIFLSSILSSVSIGCFFTACKLSGLTCTIFGMCKAATASAVTPVVCTSVGATTATCPLALIITLAIIGIICLIIIIILAIRLFRQYRCINDESEENYSEEEYSNE
ncbi:Plasmodium exported protein, unknown function [Plasmodium sp. gorilla clade G2]|uniref:Plasmodium exported protein, unknown function n=1 Tax=Plasmodium sp. gorilla clade G2 TaxID=880535 RepID=UPI000D2AA839|nr:Plasmodium exported protein, unknown function [Plasmodium sp. gorilla clade G2]SOV20096.1 Plasmodium exported protein, unknown function [Plasmodium sp. gorilla clade G2]